MLILSDKKLNSSIIEEKGAKVILLKNKKDLLKYNNNTKVVAICGSRGLSRTVNNMNLPNLKLFQLTSAGFDGVPIENYAKNNIVVANAGNVYSVPIAETVVFGLLQYAKRLRNNPNNRNFKLLRNYNLITELAEKRVLIMGAGNIGTAVAERLKGFNMNIDGYDPYCPIKSPYKVILRSRQELKEQIGDYDYIISTLPDNEDTVGFINAELFDLMKSSAVIINVGRNVVFNQHDFFLALKKKKICGAILDMFEKIPNPITNKFRRLRNVIVLPGVAAISKELDIRLRDFMTENVISVIQGKTIKNVINGVL